MANLHAVEAEVLGTIKNGYRLKVSVLELGFYMFAWTARRTDRNVSGWWIQPPANLVNGQWKSVVEFDKSKSLWPEIEQAVIDAVNITEAGTNAEWVPTDKEMTDAGIAKGLDEVFEQLEPDNPNKDSA